MNPSHRIPAGRTDPGYLLPARIVVRSAWAGDAWAG